MACAVVVERLTPPPRGVTPPLSLVITWMFRGASLLMRDLRDGTLCGAVAHAGWLCWRSSCECVPGAEVSRGARRMARVGWVPLLACGMPSLRQFASVVRILRYAAGVVEGSAAPTSQGSARKADQERCVVPLESPHPHPQPTRNRSYALCFVCSRARRLRANPTSARPRPHWRSSHRSLHRYIAADTSVTYADLLRAPTARFRRSSSIVGQLLGKPAGYRARRKTHWKRAWKLALHPPTTHSSISDEAKNRKRRAPPRKTHLRVYRRLRCLIVFC